MSRLLRALGDFAYRKAEYAAKMSTWMTATMFSFRSGVDHHPDAFRQPLQFDPVLAPFTPHGIKRKSIEDSDIEGDLDMSSAPESTKRPRTEAKYAKLNHNRSRLCGQYLQFAQTPRNLQIHTRHFEAQLTKDWTTVSQAALAFWNTRCIRAWKHNCENGNTASWTRFPAWNLNTKAIPTYIGRLTQPPPLTTPSPPIFAAPLPPFIHIAPIPTPIQAIPVLAAVQEKNNIDPQTSTLKTNEHIQRSDLPRIKTQDSGYGSDQREKVSSDPAPSSAKADTGSDDTFLSPQKPEPAKPAPIRKSVLSEAKDTPATSNVDAVPNTDQIPPPKSSDDLNSSLKDLLDDMKTPKDAAISSTSTTDDLLRGLNEGLKDNSDVFFVDTAGEDPAILVQQSRSNVGAENVRDDLEEDFSGGEDSDSDSEGLGDGYEYEGGNEAWEDEDYDSEAEDYDEDPEPMWD